MVKGCLDPGLSKLMDCHSFYASTGAVKSLLLSVMMINVLVVALFGLWLLYAVN